MALPNKRKALSLQDKMKILKYFDKKSHDYKKSQIAAELEIPISTLWTIIKHRSNIEKRCNNVSNVYLNRKKQRNGKYMDIENVLIDWILSMNAQNVPLNGPTIKKRALEIAQELDVYDFTASNGWYSRFKWRHQSSLKHDNLDTIDDDSSSETYESYHDLVKDYQPCDIFNADEFGLFFKLMPNELPVLDDKICQDGKLPEQRWTVLACSNATGSEKLPLLIIGNKIHSDKDLSCQYLVDSKSWITKTSFSNWLNILDEYFEIQGRLVILFIDQNSVHPRDVILNNINLVIMPSGAEHEMPMSHGIITAIKQNYRIKLIEDFNRGKMVDINNCFIYLTEAYKSVTARTIQACFKKSGFVDYYDVDDDDDEYKEQLLIKHQDYLYADYELTICESEKRNAVE